jgi:hypothetical protein
LPESVAARSAAGYLLAFVAEAARGTYQFGS